MRRRWVNEEETSWAAYFVYTPWFALEQGVLALLRCLGFRRYPSSSTGHGNTTTTSTDHQPDSKSPKKEEMEVGSRSIAIAARRPPRPPVSSGRGGKTN